MRIIFIVLTIAMLSINLYPQTMTTIPTGLRLITPCHYCYGCAVASDGSVWFTEFNHQQLRKWIANGQVWVQQIGIAGMFGLAIDNSSNVFVGLDLGDVSSPSKILRILPNGTQSYVVSGITRPRQLTTDAAGNVYFATESPSQISRWNASSGKVDTLVKNLTAAAEGVAVASDGTIYFSEYGYPESGIHGTVKKRATNGTVTVLDSVWRARGVALDSINGYLYLCTESDQQDHGNSGMLYKIRLSDNTLTKALEGIDYPQFPSMGKDGRVYFAMTRDSWIGAYDPTDNTTANTFPGNSEITLGINGGTWGPSLSGGKLNINLEDTLKLYGNVHASQSGGTVYGWIRVPYNQLPTMNSNELYTYRCDPEHPAPGMFELPAITYATDSGSCLITAVALRQHTGKRWPMANPGTCNETAAPGFGESPIAYLLYFAWSPVNRVNNVLAPSYNDTVNKMTIVKGSGLGWIYANGSWSPSAQTWLSSGWVNSPPASSAWAELDLGSFSGQSKYVYIMWHKNGPYRPHLAHFDIYDFTADKFNTQVDETKHADGLSHADDTFSGWYLMGDRKINITPSTKLRVSNDAAVGSSEYLQSDAVMLSDYPIISNTSVGSVDNFEGMQSLSVSDVGPTGVWNHWGMQGLSEQYTTTANDSSTAQLSSNIYPDAPAGYYWVDVSWTYFNTDSLNALNAQYSINGTTISNSINQNRSATNQGGQFVQGNSIGTWSGFYRLSGSYYYSSSQPLNVSLHYNSSRYAGRKLVVDMIRFLPDPPLAVTKVNEKDNPVPSSFVLFQNYPNPFNPSTTIKYSIPQTSFVSLKVYNVLGQEITSLYNGVQKAGTYEINFDASKYASGVYIYRLQTNGFTSVKKMLLLK